MSNIIPFKNFSKKTDKLAFISNFSVITDDKDIPLGFVFGRDSFISFLEHIDSEFEINVKDPKIAYNNPAGKLIDLIEENLDVNPELKKDLKKSVAKNTDWIPLEEIMQSLHA